MHSAIGAECGTVARWRPGVSIGETLAEARRQAGLTVTQVSQRTRIRETVIKEIEGDDYSACGGDFYARGHIRSIAKVAGADPEPLIREYDAAHRAPGALSAVSMAELARSAQAAGRRGPNRTALLAVALVVALVVALLVALGFVAYNLLAGSGHAASAPSAAGNHVVAHRHGGHVAALAPSPRPTIAARPTITAQTTIPAQPLTPVSAAAFGPYSAGQGDSPQLAPLAIDGNPATAWHTDWYTTARFGNLYPGTGLLLDMGRPVTMTPPGSLSAAFPVPTSSCVSVLPRHWPTCRPWPARAMRAAWCFCGSPRRRAADMCSSGSPGCRRTRPAPSRRACTTSGWKAAGEPASGIAGRDVGEDPGRAAGRV